MIKHHNTIPIIVLFSALQVLPGCSVLKTAMKPGTDQAGPQSATAPAPAKPVVAAKVAPAVEAAVDLGQLDTDTLELPSLSVGFIDNQLAHAINEFRRNYQFQPTTDNLVIQEIKHEAELALNHQVEEDTADAWSRLRQGMQIEVVLNKRVRAQMDWYLSHRDYLTRTMQRARPVLPFILDVLEEKELPTELALLPIVESAYQTFAYSHGRASGMWQIIPSTGRYLGLKQNWWYDGRRDIIQSTHAATNYLQTLAQQFDQDWELALAAYNAGPGKVRSAIRYNKKKGRKTDFWNLTRFRRETKDYVPKLLALKEIFANPEKYDLELVPIDNETSYAIVELDSQLDLALAADLAGITTEELYQLNPAFNRWATAPNGPHRLLLPRESVDQFKTELAELPRSKRINWIRHKIKNGETLSHLAIKYRTTTKLIKQLNKIRGSQIRAGKYLLIPTATRSLSDYSLSKSARLSKIKNTPRKGHKITHKVKNGESFWLIARKYDVNTRALAKWNGMAPTDTLRVGQQLVIWKNSDKAQVQRVSFVDTSPQRKMHALRYTVRKGDSLSTIAGKFNIRVADIRKWNKIGKYLQPGQKLKLLVDITRQSG